MGSTLETVVFYFLAAFIIAMSIMTVTTQRIVRSATYLLFVLFGTAGIYFLLGYTFLGSVQIMVYAGGIVVWLYIAFRSNQYFIAGLYHRWYHDRPKEINK